MSVLNYNNQGTPLGNQLYGSDPEQYWLNQFYTWANNNSQQFAQNGNLTGAIESGLQSTFLQPVNAHTGTTNLIGTATLARWLDFYKKKKLQGIDANELIQQNPDSSLDQIITLDNEKTLQDNKVLYNSALESGKQAIADAGSLGEFSQKGTAIGNAVGSAIGGKAGAVAGNSIKGIGNIVDASKNIKSINDATNAARKAAEDAGETFNGLDKAGLAKGGNAMAIAGAVAGIADSFLGERAEYSGDKGNITLTLDTVYDGISDAAMSMGPIGMIVGGAMKGLDFLGDGLAKLGGGTDGMTTLDAILGSSFFSWNVGLINGFGGKTTDTITKDEDTFALIGSSYGGTNAMVDDAVHKSGKKYGLFSRNQYNKAQQLIQESKRQQSVMQSIAGNARDRFAIQDSMSTVNKNRYLFDLQGGYNQSGVRAAKEGMLFTTNLAEVSIDDYMISSSILEISIDGLMVSEYKEGGVIKEVEIPDIVVETNFESYMIQEFLKGGQFNIIPEGALHARLHHMENADNLTKKGIPVVSEKANGELELQAEIEREEIIFRLDVTLRIESLYRKYKSEEYTQKEKDLFAIEVGKLLTFEILRNTVDHTNNLI